MQGSNYMVVYNGCYTLLYLWSGFYSVVPQSKIYTKNLSSATWYLHINVKYPREWISFQAIPNPMSDSHWSERLPHYLYIWIVMWSSFYHLCGGKGRCIYQNKKETSGHHTKIHQIGLTRLKMLWCNTDKIYVPYHTTCLFSKWQHHEQKHTMLKITYNIKNDRTTKPQSRRMMYAYQTTWHLNR
jgi:hypothetical protein